MIFMHLNVIYEVWPQTSFRTHLLELPTHPSIKQYQMTFHLIGHTVILHNREFL